MFDQLWEFLQCEGPEQSKIECPSTPDNLFDETKLRFFAGAVVQAHRLAFQKISIEVLVSFALNGPPTGITPFLESHKNLAIQVEESRTNVVKFWAWDRASRVRLCPVGTGMITNRCIGSSPLRASEASYSDRTAWQTREMERPRPDRELSVHENAVANPRDVRTIFPFRVFETSPLALPQVHA